jgi:UDP-glucose 4-epimerase
MRPAGRRVVVTGGAGFVGSHLVEYLLDMGDVSELRVLDNLETGSTENLADFEEDPRLVLTIGTVLDRSILDELFADADVVFHLACLGLRHSLHAPVENFRVNAEGTLNVALGVATSRVDRFVHVSSSEVFGSAAYAPMDESHPTQPTTVYGAAKLAGETAVRAVASLTGIRAVIARPFNMYGPRSHAAGDAGEIIPRTIVRALRGLPPIIYGDGEQTRDFLHVRDVIVCLRSLADCDAAIGRAANIGSGREVTMNDLCAAIASGTGHPELIAEHQPARPADVRRLVGDHSLATELVGFRPVIPFEEGLAETIAWFARDQSRLVDVPSRNWEYRDHA